MRHPVVLDGGLATTLQRSGLPVATAVDDWLLQRPEQVADAHRAFAAAGAEVVLAGSFRALPHIQPRWREVLARALDCASAASDRVAASVGPGGTATRPWDGDCSAHAAVARWLQDDGRAELLVLETFVSAVELQAVVSAIRPLFSRTLVACLSPGPDGRLWSGEAVGPALDQVRALGADLVGLNCGPGVPEAAATTPVDWVKPNAGPEGPSPQDIAATAALGAGFVGGCCGWGPEHVRALVARLRDPAISQG